MINAFLRFKERVIFCWHKAHCLQDIHDDIELGDVCGGQIVAHAVRASDGVEVQGTSRYFQCAHCSRIRVDVRF